MARFDGNYHRGSQSKNNQKAPKAPPPYNFIKPDKRVFYPQDFGEVSDDKISFEKPFSDSQSGILEIKITAKSDIFTGKNTNTQKLKEFFTIRGKHALSGSSVRGAIRTIAQVLSFAKFDTKAPDYKDEKGNVTPRDKQIFNESKLDMVERIFGIVSQNAKVQALKSRISFSHFIVSKVCKANHISPKYAILDAIKEAKKKGKVPEFCKENGFRFYTPLKSIGEPLAPDKTGDTITTISPLGKGSVFVGKLRYFNLTKSELGLLLLCLTALRDDKGECYKFGGAKFYGYGDARIEIKGIDEGIKNECINAYKNLLAKANFEVESRIESLRKVSKLQSTQSTIPQNKPASYTPATRKIDDRYSQNIRDRLHQDDDDDWNGL